MRLGIFILFFPLTSFAGWLELEETYNENFYYSTPSVKKSGDHVTVTILSDIKQMDPDGEMSRTGDYEFNCVKEKFRNLSAVHYAEPMGQGRQIMISRVVGEWVSIHEKTLANKVHAIICQ